MQKEEIKFEGSTVLEGMTSLRGLFAAREAGVNDRPILRILFNVEREKKISRELGYLRAMGDKYGFPVLPVSAEEIDSLALGTSHGGILAECGERNLPKLSDARSSIVPN